MEIKIYNNCIKLLYLVNEGWQKSGKILKNLHHFDVVVVGRATNRLKAFQLCYYVIFFLKHLKWKNVEHVQFFFKSIWEKSLNQFRLSQLNWVENNTKNNPETFFATRDLNLHTINFCIVKISIFDSFQFLRKNIRQVWTHNGPDYVKEWRLKRLKTSFVLILNSLLFCFLLIPH